MLTATNKHIYITGYGYMGKKLHNALLERQLADKEKITSIARSTPGPRHDSPFISWDLDQEHPLPGNFPEDFPHNQAIIYYFVPPPPRGRKDLRTRNFINKLEQHTAHASNKIHKIVLISTTGVYGNCHGQWVDENTPLNPSVDRAHRRVDAEQQFQHYAQRHQIPLVILRVSGIYAPDKLPLKRIRAQTPVVREQDSPYSNRIHADDLLEICLLAGLQAGLDGIYNCSDGHPTTMYDYFMRVARACKLPPPPAISLEQARSELSSGMLSYMDESRRISNKKLLDDFKIRLQYPDLQSGLAGLA